MWHFISEHISEVTGTLFLCTHIQRVSGGDTHDAYIIHDEHTRYFVKTRAYDDTQQLHLEAEGLDEINAANTLLTPRVICWGLTKNEHPQQEYLVLSHIRFIAPKPDDFARLGAQLAAMHSLNKYTQYGWLHDNYIGASIQTNGRSANWSEFFAEQRIASMLERLAIQGHQFTTSTPVVQLCKDVLSSHCPHPALVHGDLWHGNIGFCHKGPVIFDPAIYIGDGETDLAMAELFGGFPSSFFEGYAGHTPIDKNYAKRKLFYQFYHILNHTLLFGAHYQQQADMLLQKINAL